MSYYDYSKFKDKTVTVPWSGGVDSTLLILELLNVGARVRVISFTGRQLPNAQHESYVRSKILSLLDDKYKIDRTVIDLPGAQGGLWPDNYYFSQQSLWNRLLPLYAPQCDVVMMGYLATDGILAKEKMIRYEWHSGDFNAGNPTPPLEFPLGDLVKKAVVTRLIDLSRKMGIPYLVRHTSTCYKTVKVGSYIFRCGKCEMCATAKHTGIDSFHPTMDISNNQSIKRIFDIDVQDGTAEYLYVKSEYGLITKFLSIPLEEEDSYSKCAGGLKLYDPKYSRGLLMVKVHDANVDVGVAVDSIPDDSIVLNEDEYLSRAAIFIWQDSPHTDKLQGVVKDILTKEH